MSKITRDAALTALSHHISAAHGARADVLVEEITGQISEPWTERALRYTITALRMEGHHICGTPDAGYFMASTADELNETCEFLYQRALTSLKQVAQMKRCSLPDLRGQLRLPT